ncbi:MAG TPA: hypothetical protein VFE24_15245 [Pirellulales bacterium]|jgi:hypothetical protein|nr:hypothetical protein [Pirellulales bacterium]
MQHGEKLMRRTCLAFCVALCGSTFAGAAAPAAGDFTALVHCVPSSANTLVLIDTQKILATGVAQAEDWKDKLEKAHAAGLTIMPANAERGVFASNMDFSFLSPMWETVVLDLDHDPNLKAFALRAGGTVETVQKHTVVALPGNAYAVAFGGRIVGAMAPASRQTVARWLSEIGARPGVGLSTYLTEAYKYSNDLGTPIIMAIDLENVVTPADVRTMLKANEKYKNLPDEKLAGMADFLAGIRGLTLGVTFGEKPFGKVKVDFASKVPFTPEEGKAALLNALSNRGVMLDELRDWKPQVSENQISLEGNFTSSGLRRLFSLISPAPSFQQAMAKTPTTPPAVNPPAVNPSSANPSTPEESKMRVASTAYFKDINTYLRDLKIDNADAVTMGSVAMWYNKYASKLDQMPTLDVDPALKQFGAYAADSMRSAASALQNAGIAVPARQAEVAPVYDYYTHNNIYGYVVGNPYWGNGYSGPVGNSTTYAVENRQEEARQKRQIHYQEWGDAFKYANETMQKVYSTQAQVRQQMSAKYKVNF